MNNNDRLRGLEIQFYLVCYDVIHLTKPITTRNLENFFKFLEEIDFTKSLNYSILKTLAFTIFTENTNIQPNKVEFCNFCYTHQVKLRDIRKYVNIPKTRTTLRLVKYRQITSINLHIFKKKYILK